MNTYREFHDFVGTDMWLCPQLSKMWAFYPTDSKLSDQLKLESDFRHLHAKTRDIINGGMTKEMIAMYGLREKENQLVIVIDNQQRRIEKVDENTLHFIGDNKIELRRQLIL